MLYFSDIQWQFSGSAARFQIAMEHYCNGDILEHSFQSVAMIKYPTVIFLHYFGLKTDLQLESNEISTLYDVLALLFSRCVSTG